MKERKIILVLLIIIFSLTCAALIVNVFLYKYPGNNYFPVHSLSVVPILLLIYGGFCLQGAKYRHRSQSTGEVLWFYFILAMAALATNAVQFTPFNPIDSYIISFEKWLRLDLISLLVWVKSWPLLHTILSLAYDFLSLQLVLLPLIVIVMRRQDLLTEYYVLLLFTLLLGFVFYYFFPTTAPASMFPAVYFSEYQIATGLKFSQIHQHIKPTTIEGGLIGLPSFHMIWAWLSLYLIREFKILFCFLLPINILIILACVLLGWHYLTDLIASCILLFFAHGFLIMQRAATKRSESSCKNHSSIQ